MSDESMKMAEELALRFAQLVAKEREHEFQLAKIRTEKEESLRRLLAVKPGNGTSPDGGVKERVFELLESDPLRVFATAEVGELLKIAPNVASAYLSELSKKDQRIVRIAKGHYQSTAYQPLIGRNRHDDETESLKTD